MDGERRTRALIEEFDDGGTWLEEKRLGREERGVTQGWGVEGREEANKKILLVWNYEYSLFWKFWSQLRNRGAMCQYSITNLFKKNKKKLSILAWLDKYNIKIVTC